MRQITAFTSDPTQNITLILDDGAKVAFAMRYVTNQAGWFADITYGDTVLCTGRRLVTSPNLLRAFRGIIPFGIAITVSDGLEPIYIDDFSNGRAIFFLLNEADVAGVEDLIKAR